MGSTPTAVHSCTASCKYSYPITVLIHNLYCTCKSLTKLVLVTASTAIPYQLRSGNTQGPTTTKRTKRANDFYTFKFL